MLRLCIRSGQVSKQSKDCKLNEIPPEQRIESQQEEKIGVAQNALRSAGESAYESRAFFGCLMHLRSSLNHWRLHGNLRFCIQDGMHELRRDFFSWPAGDSEIFAPKSQWGQCGGSCKFSDFHVASLMIIPFAGRRFIKSMPHLNYIHSGNKMPPNRKFSAL